MNRVVTIIVLAVLAAAISGVNDASWARQVQDSQAQEKHRQQMAARLKGIAVGSVVRIERADGTRFNAILEEVMPDAIAVTLLDRRDLGRQTIPIDEIRDIEPVRGRRLRNVLIAAGVAGAILVGTCAAALNSETLPRQSVVPSPPSP